MDRIDRKALIIGALRRRRSSRYDLSKELGFSPAITGMLVGDLLENGFLREAGYAGSTGGRPGMLLELSGNCCVALGLDFEATRLTCVAVNFRGELLCTRQRALTDQSRPDEILRNMEELARETLDALPASSGRFLGMGVALPGLASYRRGVAISCTLFRDWRDIPVRETLSERLGAPVYVEKNKHTAALAERWFGNAGEVGNFVCLVVRSGLGIGVFVDGHLLKGENENAGEIGHIAVAPDGPVCSCGATGCLGTFLSSRAVLDRARAVLQSEVRAEHLPASLDDLIALATNGSEPARELFRETGRYLGIAVANVINIFNPALVVISGDLPDAREMMQESMEEAFRERALSYSRDCARVEFSKLNRSAPALGAATLVLADMTRHLRGT